MKTATLLLAFVLSQSACATPPRGPTVQAEVVQGALGRRLDSLMNGFLPEGYSGAVLVARGDDVVLRKGYGLADRERGIPNAPSTLFHVASVGKIFTAAAILKLEMEGRLATLDPIGKYLGAFPGEKNAATIHHLLTHTAGLSVDSSAPGSRTKLDYGSRAAFVQSMKDAPIESKPGEKYRYSSAGYVLLAAIVEVVAGQPFERYLRQSLFQPAGLASTAYPWERMPDDPRVAVGYVGSTLAELKPTPRVADVWGNRGPGHLLTTVEDLYSWTRALRDDRVLSRKAREKMFTAYTANGEGYGWHVEETPRKTTMVRRGGGRPDFESEVRWYTDEDTVILFTINNDLNLRRRVAPALEKAVFE